MDIQLLTWIMTTVGFTGFILAGRKIWWAWYVNLAVQVLWALYALATGQLAFLASAAAYFGIFGVNAYKWTKDHRDVKKALSDLTNGEPGSKHILPGGVEVTLVDVSSKHPPEYFEYKLDTEDDGMIIHNTKLDGSPAYSTFDLELIARTCHEANRVLQLNHDDEQVSYAWHIASEEQKASAIEGVKKALEGATAIELHEAWARRKLEDGWVYGETKDEGIRTHPCLVPYDKLPEEQRLKDHMFRAIVKSFKVDAQEKASVI